LYWVIVINKLSCLHSPDLAATLVSTRFCMHPPVVLSGCGIVHTVNNFPLLTEELPFFGPTF
ncbi:hypothetical protein P7K49_013755, partial [Saguinus oedipus]